MHVSWKEFGEKMDSGGIIHKLENRARIPLGSTNDSYDIDLAAT
jgi:hypothetical protein